MISCQMSSVMHYFLQEWRPQLPKPLGDIRATLNAEPEALSNEVSR